VGGSDCGTQGGVGDCDVEVEASVTTVGDNPVTEGPIGNSGVCRLKMHDDCEEEEPEATDEPDDLLFDNL
jgi:hypothetical protein